MHIENIYFYSEPYALLLNGTSGPNITAEGASSSRQEVELLTLKIGELNLLFCRKNK